MYLFTDIHPYRIGEETKKLFQKINVRNDTTKTWSSKKRQGVKIILQKTTACLFEEKLPPWVTDGIKLIVKWLESPWLSRRQLTKEGEQNHWTEKTKSGLWLAWMVKWAVKFLVLKWFSLWSGECRPVNSPKPMLSEETQDWIVFGLLNVRTVEGIHWNQLVCDSQPVQILHLANTFFFYK